MKIQHPLARSLVTVTGWPFFIDLGIGACVLAVFLAIVHTCMYWFQRPVPVIPISTSFWALPVYAFYSIGRMCIAYALSLIFAIAYGYIATYNRRFEPWMVGLLDILQSIPVLSFLPPVVLAMVALIPGHQLGIEMGVILLIFTGQVWNLAFSFYSSLKTIPREMIEASRIFRYSAWQLRRRCHPDHRRCLPDHRRCLPDRREGSAVALTTLSGSPSPHSPHSQQSVRITEFLQEPRVPIHLRSPASKSLSTRWPGKGGPPPERRYD